MNRYFLKEVQMANKYMAGDTTEKGKEGRKERKEGRKEKGNEENKKEGRVDNSHSAHSFGPSESQ